MEAKFDPIEGDPCYHQLSNGVNYFFEDEALLTLLKEEVCHFGSMWHPDKDMKDEGAYLGIGVFVNCNDTFYWATADSESLRGSSDVEELYRLWKSDPCHGPIIWACKHRNLQPQKPLKNMMIKEGVWSPELESLPEPEPS